MRLFRKYVDEREELEFLRVERIGFWVMFWGLTLAIVVQFFFDNFSPSLVIPEIIVLMAGSVLVTIGNIRKGLWSRSIRLSVKSNIICSLIGALAASLIGIFLGFYKLPGKELLNFLLSVVYRNFLPTGIACFALLSVCSAITKRRRQKLESEFEGNEETKG